MKRIITLFVLLTTTLIYSQSSGITYQAVLYNPSGEILPGNNNANAVLSNKDICLRFSITDSQTSLEYQETQRVTTDEFGMVNLVIGSGNQIGGYAASFTTIVWNSTTKKLQVAIDVAGSCSNFVEISNQNFSAVPFAYSSKTAESVSGVVPIVNGGTGSSTVSGAKTNLGLNNVDNTSDVNKPISNDTQTALTLKENAINKSTNTALGTSDVLFPTQNAVKTYVDSQLSSGVVDATSTIKGKIKLAGDISGTADLPIIANNAINSSKIANGAVTDTKITSVSSSKVIGSIPVSQINGAVSKVNGVLPNGDGSVVIPFGMVRTGTLALRPNVGTTTNGDIYVVSGDSNANNNGLTYISDGQNWNEVTPNQASLDARYLKLGGGTMSGNIIVPAGKFISINDVPTSSTDAANKAYVDSMITGGATPDATTISLGKIQLAGDLGGTATSPTVPGLASKEPTITSGTTSQYFRGDKTWQTLDKTALGLGNVDNTSDASKPISTATQTALNAKENTIAAGTTAQYYRGDKTWQTLDKTAVGLNNVNDTSDASKPISTDTQAALDLKANLASPTFTGDAKAATAATGDNDTSIATTAFVSTAITNAATPNATTSSLGKIQLGGDLAGPSSSASAPIITNGAITTLKLADASVTNAKIGETITVAKGGTGSTSLTGYLKGNGTSAFTTESTIPVANVAGAVRSVNGALPATDGNVSVLIGNVYTGNGITPTTGTTPVRSDIYIVAGQTGTPNDNGRTFIYDGTTWHEISTNIAALDNTFVKLSGSTMSGNLVFPTGKKITIADAPTGSTDVANRGYVDTKIGGSGTTNYVPKFLGTSPSNTLTNSSIFDDGTKVGIGTTTPTTVMSVQGSANVDNANANTGTIANSLLFGNGTGEGIGSTRTGTTNLFGINFFTNYTLQMALTSAGRLGLGTTSPFTPLSNTSSNIFGSDGQGVNGFSWSTGVSGYTAAIYNSVNTATYNGLAVKVANNAATTYALDVSRGTAQATAGTPLFDVLGNGNVGVGTASPASKLDVSAGITSVNSAINATGSINDFLQYNIQNTSTGPQAQSGYSATADNGNATSGFAWLGINNSGFNYPTAYNIGGANDVSFVGSGQDMYLANANNTKSIIFSTGKSTTPFFNEQMRILNNGNVGIGTNAPANKLEIKQGTAGNSGLRFTNLNSSSTATTSASKVLGLNSTGDVILTNIPGTQNIVSFSTASPNTGSPVFTPNTPADQSVIYQSATDNSLWTYNGTTYVTYTAPATTAWNLGGTANDAGSNKTAGIARSGFVTIGATSALNTGAPLNVIQPTIASLVTLGAFYSPNNNTAGSIMQLAFGQSNSTGNNAESRFIYQGNNASTNRVDFGISGNANPMISYLNNGNVGIGTSTPVSTFSNTSSTIQGSNSTNAFNGGLTWSTLGTGFAGSFYSQPSNGNGLQVKIAGTTSSSNALEVSTGATQTGTTTPLFNVLGNGNVGIGTTTPSSTLHVNSNVTATSTINADAQVFKMMRPQNPGFKWENIAQFNLGSYANSINATSRLDLAMNDGSGITTSNVMTWQANGNVGVGTSSPLTKLIVNDNAYISNIPTTTANLMDNSTFRPLTRFQTTSGINNNAISHYLTTTVAATQAHNYSTGASLPYVLQPAGGNVGIGTVSPSAPLVAQGITGNGVLKLIAPSVAAGDNWWIGFGHGTSSTDANDRARLGVDIAGGGAGRLFFTTGAPGSQTRALFIDESQRVGIGTSSPVAQLHTTGSVRFAGAGTPGVGKVLTSDASGNAMWQYNTVNAKTSDFTLAASDYGTVIVVNSATTVVLTIPPTLPAGFYCQIIQQAAGQVSVVGDTGVSVTSAMGTKSRTTGSSIGVMLTTSTTAFLSGDTGF